jgi:hypothetical protein
MHRLIQILRPKRIECDERHITQIEFRRRSSGSLSFRHGSGGELRWRVQVFAQRREGGGEFALDGGRGDV